MFKSQSSREAVIPAISPKRQVIELLALAAETVAVASGAAVEDADFETLGE